MDDTRHYIGDYETDNHKNLDKDDITCISNYDKNEKHRCFHLRYPRCMNY
jgi:hypothetical protein